MEMTIKEATRKIIQYYQWRTESGGDPKRYIEITDGLDEALEVALDCMRLVMKGEDNG